MNQLGSTPMRMPNTRASWIDPPLPNMHEWWQARFIRRPMKIIYTHTDEAPALATQSLLPIVRAFAGAGRGRDRAARHLARRPHPGPVPRPLRRAAGPGRARPSSASWPRRPRRTSSSCRTSAPRCRSSSARSRSCRSRASRSPTTPRSPRPTRSATSARATTRSRARPSTRCCARATPTAARPRSVKAYARKPTRTRWASGRRTRRTHVATMGDGDFRSTEQSVTVAEPTATCASSTSPPTARSPCSRSRRRCSPAR